MGDPSVEEASKEKTAKARQGKQEKVRRKERSGLNSISKLKAEVRVLKSGGRRPLPPSFPNPDQSSRARNHFRFYFQRLRIWGRQGPMGVGRETDLHPERIFPPFFSSVFSFLLLLFSLVLRPPFRPPIALFGPAFPPYFSPSRSPWREATSEEPGDAISARRRKKI